MIPRDGSNTAKNGGVTNRDIQGSPTTHTGSGHISQGDTYHFHGITLEQYEAGLKRQEQEVTAKLEQAHAEDRQLLETELAEIERQLADTQTSYQNHIRDLEKRIAELETVRGQVPDELLDQARNALEQGDSSQADQLFARIEDQAESVIRVAAEAAYQRSRIALDEIRYREAYAHAQRSVQLAPQEARYLSSAGELAQLLGDYRAAKDYHQQALTIDLETLGEDHPDVATDRNNLGMAWQALGEYEQAIGYYEQALAIFEHRLGLEHPHTRGVRGNLAATRAERVAAAAE